MNAYNLICFSSVHLCQYLYQYRSELAYFTVDTVCFKQQLHATRTGANIILCKADILFLSLKWPTNKQKAI